MDVLSQSCIYFMCIFTVTVATDPNINLKSETHVLKQGPVVQIKCIYNITGGTAYNYTWIFQNRIIAVNGMLHNADPTRYSVQFNQPEFGGSILQIQNALKTDEGDYQCRIEYSMNGIRQEQMFSTTVTIIDYLPPKDYPKCSIEPSLTLVNLLTDATFKCEPGESSKSVELDLKLIRQDMAINNLGHQTTTTVVTKLDDGAMFECHMTSTQFLFAKRNCTAGPIRVVDSIDKLPTTTTASTKASLTEPFSSTLESTSASLHMPLIDSPHFTWIIIGAALGSVIAILLGILIFCRCQHLRKNTNESKSVPLEFSSHAPSMMDNNLVFKTPSATDDADTDSQSPTHVSNHMDDTESQSPTYASYQPYNTVKLKYASIMENNVDKPQGHLGEIEKEL